MGDEQQEESSVEVTVHNGDQTFTFSRKPIGKGFMNKFPLAIASVSDGSSAKEAGVTTGMSLKKINGADLSGCKTYADVTKILREELRPYAMYRGSLSCLGLHVPKPKLCMRASM